MGTCISSSYSADPDSIEKFNRSKNIDRQLREDDRDKGKEVKILLLGSGESGKTTILKQMQILHGGGGFTAQQREDYRQQVFINLYDGMKGCLKLLARQGMELEDQSLKASCVSMFFGSYVEVGRGEPYPDEFFERFKRLWMDEGIQKAILSAPTEVAGNIHYFFPKLDSLFSPKYVPTDQDILQCRGQTIGVTEKTFSVLDLTYRMIDVGGQQTERKKWLHCFENVTATFFLVAIDGYDAALLEDGTVNQMEDALQLFESIINSRWLSQTSMILFLNKADLFRKKLPYSPISRFFPDYQGDDTDVVSAQSYFTHRFLRLNRSSEREIYTHHTCATDTSLMRVVMDSVNDIIINRSLEHMLV